MKTEMEVKYNVSLNEKEIGKMLDDIKTLSALVKDMDVILRCILEKTPPMFASVIQKFLLMVLAMNESLINIELEENGIIAEMWAVKSQLKEGQA